MNEIWVLLMYSFGPKWSRSIHSRYKMILICIGRCHYIFLSAFISTTLFDSKNLYWKWKRQFYENAGVSREQSRPKGLWMMSMHWIMYMYTSIVASVVKVQRIMRTLSFLESKMIVKFSYILTVQKVFFWFLQNQSNKGSIICMHSNNLSDHKVEAWGNKDGW